MLNFISRSYFLEALAASYLPAMLVSFVGSQLVLISGDRDWINALVAPTLILPIAAGVLAARIARKILSRKSYFVWCVPFALFFWAFVGVVNAPYASRSEVWSTMIGTDCGGSECLIEFFFTVPFVCAVSYSVSALILRGFKRTRVISI